MGPEQSQPQVCPVRQTILQASREHFKPPAESKEFQLFNAQQEPDPQDSQGRQPLLLAGLRDFSRSGRWPHSQYIDGGGSESELEHDRYQRAHISQAGRGFQTLYQHKALVGHRATEVQECALSPDSHEYCGNALSEAGRHDVFCDSGQCGLCHRGCASTFDQRDLEVNAKLQC